jgi:tetratricopeptide (TPR) repeat protein
MGRFILLGITAAAILFAPVKGVAQDLRAQNWERCTNANGAHAAEAAIAACSALLEGHETPQNESVVLSNRADAYHSARNLPAAIADLSRILNRQLVYAGRRWAIYDRRADMRLYSGDYAGAGRDYEQAAQLLSSDDAYSLSTRGHMRAQARDFTRALDDLDHAVDARPEIASLRLRRCLARAAANQQLDLAKADCEAAQQNRATPQGHFASGLVALRASDMANAWAEFDAAVSLDRRNGRFIYARGLAARAAGRVDDAAADMAAAEHLTPGVSHYFIFMGFQT